MHIMYFIILSNFKKLKYHMIQYIKNSKKFQAKDYNKKNQMQNFNSVLVKKIYIYELK